MSVITTYCRIQIGAYSVGEEIHKIDAVDSFVETVSKIYKELKLEYPKFHKMDLLSKTAVLGIELLKKGDDSIANKNDDELALFFGNSESSEYSDKNFFASYKENKNPSPSHFVYTLPNILIGEIAIKNKWYGENLFLIFPKFDTKEYCEQIEVLIQNGSTGCVCGWVNIAQEKIDAFFFAVDAENDQGIELTSAKLVELYNQHHARY